MIPSPTSRIRTCYCGAPAPSGTCPDYPTCTPGWDDKVALIRHLVHNLDQVAARTNSPAVADAVEQVDFALCAIDIAAAQFTPERVGRELIDITSTLTGLPQFEVDLMCACQCIVLCLTGMWRGADIDATVAKAITHIDNALTNARAGS